MIISFKQNIGRLDRILRGTAGMLLLGLIIVRTFPLNTIWAAVIIVLGIFMFIESALGY
jgi:membrane-bound ClpP family serine protease